MRKIICFCLLIVLFFAIPTTASAATNASEVNVYATVSTDGSCQVTVTANIHLDQPLDSLRFPIPAKATGITLNGSRARVSSGTDAKLVDISGITGNVAGDFSINITYTLDNVIFPGSAGSPELQLPMLAGFSYPTRAFRFTVTLPGANTAKPAFSSGYHMSSIEQSLSFSASGNIISGYSLSTLKDHETLVMTLPVSELMFPSTTIELPTTEVDDTVLIICAVLALLYWILFLRCAPPRRTVTPNPVDGYAAGCMGSALCLQGIDLTLQVLSWAQLGYIFIRQEHGGRIVLYQQMDMGNERSDYERKLFKMLFNKRSSVDTSSLFYAQLCQKAAKSAGCIPAFVHHRSGNRNIFRLIAALMGAAGGVSLAFILSSNAMLQGLWIALFAIGGCLSAWHIQKWASELFLMKSKKLIVSFVLCAIWLILSAIAAQIHIALIIVFSQLLVGLMDAFGGRRTDLGKQVMSQVLGLRRYLRKISHPQLQRILHADPEYFHTMIAYALALGVEKQFASCFGQLRLPPCPYLDMGKDNTMTAAQWSQLMRQVTQQMNRRAQQLSSEQVLGFLHRLIK